MMKYLYVMLKFDESVVLGLFCIIQWAVSPHIMSISMFWGLYKQHAQSDQPGLKKNEFKFYLVRYILNFNEPVKYILVMNFTKKYIGYNQNRSGAKAEKYSLVMFWINLKLENELRSCIIVYVYLLFLLKTVRLFIIMIILL